MADNLPTSGISTQTTDSLAQNSEFTRKHVMDRPIITIADFQIAMLNGTGNTLVGSGPPAQTHVNSSLLCSMRCANTDTFGIKWKIPASVDVSKDIDVRVVFSASGTTGTVLFTPLYKSIVFGTTAIAVAATAFSSTGAATTVPASANIEANGNWSTINGGTLAALRAGIDSLILKFTCALGTVTSADVWRVEARVYDKLLNGHSY